MANFNDAFQPEAGINFDDLLGLFAGTTDPTAVGEAAPVGSLYIRSNGQLFQKIGTGDTQWISFSTGSGEATKITANDTAADYLNSKLTVSSNLTATVLNPGAIEILALDLANIGTPGTYTSITVDSKGRVTAGTNPGFLTTNQNITLTGDVTGTGSTSIATTLNNTAVVPGSYVNANLTVNSQGRITAVANGSPGAGATYLYYMANTTSQAATDPGVSFLRWNAVTLTNATQIYVDNVDDFPTDPVDLSAYFATLTPGNIMWIQDRDQATRYQRWQVTSITQETGWWRFGVTLLDSQNFTSIANNTDLAVVFNFPGTTGSVSSVAATAPAAGFTISGSPITNSGTFVFALANDLEALEGLGSAGIAVRTSTDAWDLRSIAVGSSKLSVSDGDGVAGNPTLDIVEANLTLNNIGGTLGIAKGGTNLTTVGAANTVLGTNAAGSGLEYKTISGVGISIGHTAGGITLTAQTNGTVTSVAATGSTGLVIGGSPITSSGTLTFTLGTELQALSGLTAVGLFARTAPNTYTARSIAAGTGISVTNGSGASGDPTITNTGVTSLTGTTNQVIASASTGNVTLSLPQDIHSGATPTFAQITVAGNPTSALQVATKQYVDAIGEGLKTKPAAEIIVTASGDITALGTYIYNNGTLGVGATLTANTNRAFPTIDGVTLTSTTPGENGVVIGFPNNTAAAVFNGRYNLTTVGSGSTPWVLTRCALCDEGAEIPGTFTFIKQGTIYEATGWVQSQGTDVDTDGFLDVGTDQIWLNQFSGAGSITPGAGLTKTGNTLDVGGTAGRIVANADSIDLATAGTAGTYATVTTDAYGRVTSGVATQTIATGGTGLSAIGTANQVLGVNAGATALEYKTITAGANVTVTQGVGTITIASTGGSGTPGGATTNVQFNNAGAFGGSALFNWLNTGNQQLNVRGVAATTQLAIGSATPTNTNVTTGSNNASVYIEVPTDNTSEGLRVHFKRSSPGISGWITYDYDQNAPNIRLTDEDDDPPYIQFNTIGTGTYLLPQYTSLFGGRGPLAGRTTGFEWKIGTATADWSTATTIMTLDSQYLRIPTGTTAQRPAGPTAGMQRFNTTLGRSEEYNGTSWVPTGGLVLQMVSGQIANSSGTTTVPLDNSAPTSTEGWQIWTTSFTPLSASSRIVISFQITTSHSAGTGTNICSVFAGTTNIGSSAVRTDSVSNTASQISVQIVYSPGSTAAITFSARLGNPTSGTSYCNQVGANTLGGALATEYTITEIQ